ncbi:hypothetical protein FHT78_005442 [Rhizobium sp. BK196]|uniref:hypothetical protein n=1 Tax=Rhizobium sp. BK196 TaxID=2587073 RepID=UPI00160EE335|nr:hypothetical protein [Rhizobium sp. BK196]MBB3313648.1 hypothetical protein [Rhizobium sp. BK196]
MPTYRRIEDAAETVEAWQFLEEPTDPAPDWYLEALRADMITKQAGGWYVMASDFGSLVQIDEGDWIIHRGDGMLTTLRHGVFESQFELAD